MRSPHWTCFGNWASSSLQNRSLMNVLPAPQSTRSSQTSSELCVPKTALFSSTPGMAPPEKASFAAGGEGWGLNALSVRDAQAANIGVELDFDHPILAAPEI